MYSVYQSKIPSHQIFFIVFYSYYVSFNGQLLLDEENVPPSVKKQNTADIDNQFALDDNNIETQLSSINQKKSFAARQAERMARYPRLYLIIGLTVSTLIGVLGMVFGNFSIAVDNEGWRTRGTSISLKQQQIRLLLKKKQDLFNDMDGSVWADLQENVQSGIYGTDMRVYEREKKEQDAKLAEKDVGENNGSALSSVKSDQCSIDW